MPGDKKMLNNLIDNYTSLQRIKNLIMPKKNLIIK